MDRMETRASSLWLFPCLLDLDFQLHSEMLPCYTEYVVAGITLKALADLSQQTRLVTLCRKEGLCVLGSHREAGRYPVVVVKGAPVEGEAGEGNKAAPKFNFHLRQRAHLTAQGH